MRATPFFTGTDRSRSNRHTARAAATRLQGDLSYSVLFSAAAYVIRDGRAPRDSAVLDEARRRQRMLNQSIPSRRQA